jgi:hypothetical protein
MAKTKYIARNDNAFAAQTQTFKLNIGNYSAVLALTADQILGQAQDADYFSYVLQCELAMQNGAQQWASWKDIVRGGSLPVMPAAQPVVTVAKTGASPRTAVASAAPVMPVFPDPVPAVAPGVEPRFRLLVKQIKANSNYNEAMGEALGIEGAQQTGPDLATVQPVFDVEIIGNRVEVGWGWGGNAAFLDMCEIQVDRGDGKGCVPLAFDTTPGYVDTQPFPAAPAKWTYKAIYRVGDAQVGQWSKPASITVGG